MPDPSPVHITTRSGNVRVQTAEGAVLSVDGGTIEARDDGTMHVRRAPSAGAIEVRCAPGTDVTVGTASGKVELLGALGAVRVATVSGRSGSSTRRASTCARSRERSTSESARASAGS